MEKLKRILLECSNTWKGDVNTGVQRVVRNIVKEAPEIGKDCGIETIAAVVKFDCFWSVNKKSTTALFKAEFICFLKKVYYKIRPFFKSFPPLQKIEHFLVLYSRRIMLAILNIIFFPLTLKSYFKPKLNLGKGDVLLLLDSSWMYNVWPAVKKAKDNGAVVGLVVYDIIPLMYPNFFPAPVTKRFNAWFEQAVKYADFFIGISETVELDVQRYIKHNYPSLQKRYRLDFFHLGCTLDNLSEDKPVGDKFKELFGKKKCFIAVGTIESRKNHRYLLDAFDLVWGECPGATLCLIGKIGWLSDQVMARIESHPLFKKSLFMFNSVSDTELDYCYRHSKALLFPSYVEGFGLPIVEALQYNLPVLASDIPVHREVGKDFCAYFDINDYFCLAKMIIAIEQTGQMPKVRSSKEYKPTTWQESCRDLLFKIKDLCSDAK